MIPLAVANQGGVNEVLFLTSTTTGHRLDDYYKSKKGFYPTRKGRYTFYVNEDVSILSKDCTEAAIQDGPNWPAGCVVVVNNYGLVCSRGGNGGRGAHINEFKGMVDGTLAGKMFYPGTEHTNWTFQQDDSLNILNYVVPAQPGADGGTVFSRVSKSKMIVNNYNSIAAGGGGGGGVGGRFSRATDNSKPVKLKIIYVDYYGNDGYEGNMEIRNMTPYGAGGGGGAPYGKAPPNLYSDEHLNETIGLNVIALGADMKPTYGYISTDWLDRFRISVNMENLKPDYYAPSSHFAPVYQLGKMGIKYSVRNVNQPTPPGAPQSNQEKQPILKALSLTDISADMSAYFNVRYTDTTGIFIQKNEYTRWTFTPNVKLDNNRYFQLTSKIWHDIRRDETKISEVTVMQDGEFLVNYQSVSGGLTTGGAGGSNPWCSQGSRSMYNTVPGNEQRQFSPARRWRFTRYVHTQPPTRALYISNFGDKWNDTYPGFYTDKYTAPIDWRKDTKSGDGGSIGESGTTGVTMRGLAAAAFNKTQAYADRQDFKLYDTSCFENVNETIYPGAKGGLPGLICDNAIVFNNFSIATKVKGRFDNEIVNRVAIYCTKDTLALEHVNHLDNTDTHYIHIDSQGQTTPLHLVLNWSLPEWISVMTTPPIKTMVTNNSITNVATLKMPSHRKGLSVQLDVDIYTDAALTNKVSTRRMKLTGDRNIVEIQPPLIPVDTVF